MSSDCCRRSRRRWQRPSRSGGGPDGPERSGGGSQMVTQFSRNIRAKISTAALRSPLPPLTPPHSLLPPPKETTFGFDGLTWDLQEGGAERAGAGAGAGAGGHSINDNLLASSSHCQLALNYDIIDPNLTSGGGGGSGCRPRPPVRRRGPRGE